MADLRAVVREKLFGGKLKFRSEQEDTPSDTPAEEVEEKEEE